MNDLRIADSDRVRVITLDRPDKLNALTIAHFDALRDAFVDAALRPDVACVVLTGTGRAFCAGQDLMEMAAPSMPDDGKRHGFVPCIEEIERFPKPLIAAVNGLAVGFGTTVLTHCDIVLASDEARFRLPFASLGIAPELGSTETLPRTIGPQNAAYMFFTGSWIDASDAQAMGLVWQCVPGAELIDATMDIAKRIASMPISVLVVTKQLLLAPRLEAIRSARSREMDAMHRLLGGPANREAVAAFFEQREPDFTKLDPEPFLY